MLPPEKSTIYRDITAYSTLSWHQNLFINNHCNICNIFIISIGEFVMELSIILPSEDNQGIGSSTAQYFAEKQEMHNNQRYCSTLVIDFSHP